MKKQTTRKRADIAQVIEQRRERVMTRQETWALVRRIILVAAICWVLLTQVFLIDQISGQQMFPALKDGDVVLAFRMQKSYMRGLHRIVNLHFIIFCFHNFTLIV